MIISKLRLCHIKLELVATHYRSFHLWRSFKSVRFPLNAVPNPIVVDVLGGLLKKSILRSFQHLSLVHHVVITLLHIIFVIQIPIYLEYPCIYSWWSIAWNRPRHVVVEVVTRPVMLVDVVRFIVNFFSFPQDPNMVVCDDQVFLDEALYEKDVGFFLCDRLILPALRSSEVSGIKGDVGENLCIYPALPVRPERTHCVLIIREE